MRRLWQSNRAMIVLAAIALASFVLFFPRGTKQTPPRSLGLNTEFAFPAKDTPAQADVDSAALIENANAWNRRTITFTGEAIGERMIQGDMAWIHVNDDAYSKKNVEESGGLEGYNSGHAVWLPADLARQIRSFGDYQHAGDIVKVTGVFYATSPTHGGDMAIHATSLAIVRPGHPVDHPFHRGRALLASALLALAGVLYGGRRLAARRRI